MRLLTDLEVLSINGGIAAHGVATGFDLNWVWPTPPLGFEPPIIDFVAPIIGGGLGNLGPFELGGYPFASAVQFVNASMSLQ